MLSKMKKLKKGYDRVCHFFGCRKDLLIKILDSQNKKQTLNAMTLTRNVSILDDANGAIYGEHARPIFVSGIGQADVGNLIVDGLPCVSLSPAPERDYARSRHRVRRQPCEGRQVGRFPPATLLLVEPLLVRHSQVACVLCVS